MSSSDGLKVVFRNISYQVTVGKKKEAKTRTILQDVSGSFKPGRLTAIMGASGAGKTSLLNVLAGEAKQGTLSGEIFVNEQELFGEQMKKISGFVFQDDLILSTMTVKEAIEMSAILRLPKTVSQEEKDKKVQETLDMLNLQKAANTIVGNARIKGISGGERKRTAVAMELITDPKVMFLDEPTTGLDTFTAYGVIKLLKDIARTTNRTIVATIHQPSSELYHLFDDLLLMAEGRIIYEGPAEAATDYFEAQGYQCPAYTNPADFMFMDILNNEEGESTYVNKKGETITETNQDRISRLLSLWPTTKEAEKAKEDYSNLTKGQIQTGDLKTSSSFIVQFYYLFKRGFLDSIRNPLVLMPKIFQTIVIALLLGLLYLKKDNQPANELLQNYLGVLFFLALNNVFQNTTENLTVFGAEKQVFVREHGAGYYKLAPYFISKFLIEIPYQFIFPTIRLTVIYFMVGFENDASKFFRLVGLNFLASTAGLCLGVTIACMFENLQIGLVMAPLLLLPLMLFSGFFANNDSIPKWLDWFKYLSPIKFAYEGMVRNIISDESILRSIGFSDSNLNVEKCAIILFSMCVFLLIVSYFSLYRLLNGGSKLARVGKKDKT